MIVNDLIDKLSCLPGNAEIQLEIDDRLHDDDIVVDLLGVRLTGYFEKEDWKENDKLIQYVYLHGRRK